MKFIYIVLLLTSLALNGYLFIKQSDSNSESEPERETQKSISKDTEDINLLFNSEIARLQNKLAKAEKEIEHLKSLSKTVSSQSNDTLVGSKNNLSESMSDGYLYEDIEQKNQAKVNQYQAEEFDPGWAYDSEEHLSDMITNSDLISEFSLHGISCKSSMCKLAITPYKNTDQEAVSILMGISMLAFDSPRFKDYHTRSIPNDETGELDIYFYPADEETD